MRWLRGVTDLIERATVYHGDCIDIKLCGKRLLTRGGLHKNCEFCVRHLLNFMIIAVKCQRKRETDDD